MIEKDFLARPISIKTRNSYHELGKVLAILKHNFKRDTLKKDDFEIISTQSNKVREEEQRHSITLECVEVANAASFSTDYQDVYEHLFGGDYEISFIKKDGKIKAFSIFAVLDIESKKVLHAHGGIVHPDVQESRKIAKMLEAKIKETGAEVVMAKTHNPRAFLSIARLTNSDNVYPNFITPVPHEIVEFVKKNPFLSECNDDLIVVNAYPDEKIQQPIRNQVIMKGFETTLGKFDAQAVMAVLNN